MVCNVVFLPEIEDDLVALGRADARRALKVIEERLAEGEPLKAGQPLRKGLAGCRKIRTGDIRIIYRVNHGSEVEVLVIAVGPRRNNEVYDAAEKRT